MDLVLPGAIATAIAVFAGLMALLPQAEPTDASLRERVGALIEHRRAEAASLLAQARIELSPGLFLALRVAAPLALGLAGLVVSLPLAAAGFAAGLLVPHLYLRYLVASEGRAAADDAPRVLRAMVNRSAAGGTYPDLFSAAAEAARHRWVKADFEELLGRYYAQESLPAALLEMRRRQASRNLRLLYDALVVLVRTHQPASSAATILGALGEAARTNQAIARQAAAESRGLRIQAAILAIVIPALFLYLSLVNPELIAPVTSTALGQIVLLPLAVLLEVAGIVLSWRVTRLEA